MKGENKKARPSKWRSYAVNALILVVVLVGIRAWQQRDMVSGVAPALQGVTLTGFPYELAQQTSKPVLVHFWATWCPVCRAEQGAINDIAQQGSSVITVAMQSGDSVEVVKYMKEQDIDFHVVNDPDSRIAQAWGVNSVPASFIISPDGKIRFVEVGYTTGIGLKLRLWLAGIVDSV